MYRLLWYININLIPHLTQRILVVVFEGSRDGLASHSLHLKCFTLLHSVCNRQTLGVIFKYAKVESVITYFTSDWFFLRVPKRQASDWITNVGKSSHCPLAKTLRLIREVQKIDTLNSRL